jgi:outer membrane receptor protein involved in Fe transport
MAALKACTTSALLLIDPRGRAPRITSVRHISSTATACIILVSFARPVSARDDRPALPTVNYELHVAAAAPLPTASSADLRPDLRASHVYSSAADLFRAIPGLVLGRPNGGAKAVQYLVRGFDADHGTDVAVTHDDVPVNLVSHAHGQGYADLSFLIPEMIEQIDVLKGPHSADVGNFATAAAIRLRTRDRFDEPFFTVHGGSFGSRRLAFGLSSSPRTGGTGLLAGEAVVWDGPFRRPNALTRFNLAGKWQFARSSHTRLQVSGLAYRGRWNASGLVPSRLVDAGLFDRFATLDPSEGGTSARQQVAVSYQQRAGATTISAQAYRVRSTLDLFSNFTHYASDPVEGDGILQRDRRGQWGGHVRLVHPHSLAGRPAVARAGIELRADGITGGLFRQKDRIAFATTRHGRIREQDLGLSAQEEIFLSGRARAIVGIRHERFAFDVREEGEPRRRTTPSWTGPKAGLILDASPDVLLFTNYGRGFHSNDARSAVLDPRTALPTAVGIEVGLRRRLGPHGVLTAAFWTLNLESELTWSGDEGTTEARGATRRVGFDAAARWQPWRWLSLDADVSRARARFREARQLVPGAPVLTAGGGIAFHELRLWSGDMRVRCVNSYPLSEDGSVGASGHTVADLTARRPLAGRCDLIVAVDNVFNAAYRDVQTFYASRLRSESAPVDDVHVTPGTPRAVRIALRFGLGPGGRKSNRQVAP